MVKNTNRKSKFNVGDRVYSWTMNGIISLTVTKVTKTPSGNVNYSLRGSHGEKYLFSERIIFATYNEALKDADQYVLEAFEETV